MAAEPRVTSRDPVNVVGGKDGEGREEKWEGGRETRRGGSWWGVSISNLPGPPRHFRSGSILHQNESFPSKEKLWPLSAFPHPKQTHITVVSICWKKKQTRKPTLSAFKRPSDTAALTGCQIKIWQAKWTRRQLRKKEKKKEKASVNDRKHTSFHSWWQTCFSRSYITHLLCCPAERLL